MRTPHITLVAAAVVVAVLGLSGCVASGPASSDPQLDGTWHLASGTVNGFALPIGGRSVTLTIGDAAHTGGDDPCTSYRATVTGGVGIVYVRAALTGGTRDECTTPGLATLEQLYFTALTASKFSAVNQGSLVLSSAKSMLVFVRTAPVPIANVLLTRWQLYAMPGQIPTITSGPGIHPIYLSFDGSDDLTVTSNCAVTSASYQMEGENFAVAKFITAELHHLGCTEQDRNLTNQATTMLSGPLLIDESSNTDGEPATLVITSLDDNLPIVWRAAN